MKMIFVLASMMISTSVFAGPAKKEAAKPNPAAATEASPFRKLASDEVKCGPGEAMDAEYIENQAANAKSCHEAYAAVRNCGFGSSLDGPTTAAAIGTCEKYTGKLNKSDRNLKDMMMARCERTCNRNTDGTLCLATIAFCSLDAAKFISTVNQPGN